MSRRQHGKATRDTVQPLQVNLLGGALLQVDGAAIHLPTRKAVALMAVLALEGEVSRSRLAHLLWSEFADDSARKNLRQELHRLSKTAVKDSLAVRAQAVQLNGASVDALGFSWLVTDDPQSALEVYAGPLLDGFDSRGMPEFEAWLLERREALEAQRHEALARVAVLLEQTGDLRGALEHTLALVSLDGLQERFHRDAMRLHAALGEREAALQRFETCKRILGEELGLEPLPETALLAEQVRGNTSWQPAAPVERSARPSALDVPFVGRKAVLEQLETAWRQHQVIVVMGEPGSGKSRLLREFMADKGPVLTMHGRPEDQGIAYASFSRFLREWLADPAIRLEPWMRSELSRLLPELSSTTLPGSDNTQLRLFEAASEVMRQALRGKVAVFGDDAQFVDAWSAELGRYALGRIVAGNPAHRTVSAFRKEELDEATLKPLLTLVRNNLATLIELEPLSMADVGLLVGHMSGRPATVFPERLHAVTGGNPFFLVETLRGLLERGEVQVQNNVWVTAFDDSTSDYRELSIQPTVRAAVLERVDRLGSAVRRVLEVGALSGEEQFTLAAASSATALGEFEVLEALEAATTARLIESKTHRYRFTHDLVAHSLADGLSPDRTRLIHRRLAAHLETVGTQSARVAEHHARGGAHLEAARAWARAATESHAVFAFPDSLACYDRSLEQWQQVPGHASEQLELMVGRFWLARQIGASNDPALVDAMLELANTAQERGNALFAKAVVLGDAKEHEPGLEAAKRAVEQFLEAKDDNAAFYALTVCGARARALNRFDEAIRIATEALEVAERVGPLNLVDAHQELSAAHESQSDHQRALEASLRALEVYSEAMASGIKETSGHWLLGARVQHSLAKNLRHLGRCAEALEHANNAVAQATERNVPRRELEFLTTRAQILTALARTLEAHADLERALPIARQLQLTDEERSLREMLAQTRRHVQTAL